MMLLDPFLHPTALRFLTQAPKAGTASDRAESLPSDTRLQDTNIIAGLTYAVVFHPYPHRGCSPSAATPPTKARRASEDTNILIVPKTAFYYGVDGTGIERE